MDDLTNSPPVRWTVSRACETSRLQGQLLARAYQHLFPRVHRSIIDRGANPAPAALSRQNGSTAARVAAGA